jgi:hypothetical protein
MDTRRRCAMTLRSRRLDDGRGCGVARRCRPYGALSRCCAVTHRFHGGLRSVATAGLWPTQGNRLRQDAKVRTNLKANAGPPERPEKPQVSAGLSSIALARWASAGRPELQRTTLQKGWGTRKNLLCAKSLRCRAEVPGATFKPKDDALGAQRRRKSRGSAPVSQFTGILRLLQ